MVEQYILSNNITIVLEKDKFYIFQDNIKNEYNFTSTKKIYFLKGEPVGIIKWVIFILFSFFGDSGATPYTEVNDDVIKIYLEDNTVSNSYVLSGKINYKSASEVVGIINDKIIKRKK